MAELKYLVFSIIAAFVVVGLLDGDVYKGIFTGVFIFSTSVLLPHLYKAIFSQPKQISTGFFSEESYGVLVFSLVTLSLTSLIAGIIFSILNIDYCDEKSPVFSEKQCAMQKAENAINEQYDNSYDYESTL
ncbi:MAG: hypothetical protein AAB517_03245 [Patescibacteria group bacterium]